MEFFFSYRVTRSPLASSSGSRYSARGSTPLPSQLMYLYMHLHLYLYLYLFLYMCLYLDL